ncbi:MAG: hypothetical protein FWB96_08340 [Defluviitaleaceae bacterium]|nr:hypothetical protein [Defluviitaleaceae bacterium]MCL2263426.1 hypothetical protein [Defluviitaleaceae bacterium]
MKKIAMLIICAIAVVGYAMPAISVHLSVLGIQETYNFRLSSAFEDGGLLSQLNLADSDLADILTENEAVRNISRRIFASVATYLLSLLFFATAILLFFTEKNKKRVPIRLALIGDALIFHIASALLIRSVPPMVARELQRLLWFLARFINVDDILQIELATGYWVTLSAIAAAGILMLIPWGTPSPSPPARGQMSP